MRYCRDCRTRPSALRPCPLFDPGRPQVSALLRPFGFALELEERIRSARRFVYDGSARDHDATGAHPPESSQHLLTFHLAIPICTSGSGAFVRRPARLAPGSMRSTRPDAFRKRLAGLTPGASSTICTSLAPQHSQRRHCGGSASCMRSRHPSGASHRMNDCGSDSNKPSRCWPTSKSG